MPGGGTAAFGGGVALVEGEVDPGGGGGSAGAGGGRKDVGRPDDLTAAWTWFPSAYMHC